MKTCLMLAGILVVAAGTVATADEPSAHLSVTRSADGGIVATVEGTVRACGITAIGAEPSLKRDGNVIEVHQPTAGIACMNPPAQTKPYRHSVDLGKLPPGTYTIRWNFPELDTTYTVK